MKVFNPYALMRLRTIYGMSRRELAERCGLTEMTIFRYETGKGNPLLTTVYNLAEVLDCETCALMKEVDREG